MANCMANKIYIQLRNKIFYYRVELPRVNNKRRYKIISLHTQDYYEAKERIKQMVALEEQFVRLQRLFNNLIFEKVDNSDIVTIVSPFDKKRLSKRNDVKDVSELYSLYCSMAQDIKNLTEEKQALMQKIESLEGVIKEFIGPLNTMMAEFNKATPVTTSSNLTLPNGRKSLRHRYLYTTFVNFSRGYRFGAPIYGLPLPYSPAGIHLPTSPYRLGLKMTS